MTKKYELTDNIQEIWGHTLHQIKALKSFGDVKKGDLGGWIEDYSNLSQSDTSWVYDNAKVYKNAVVYGQAQISGNAWVYNHTKVLDNAKVYGEACIYDHARVLDNAQVGGNAWVYNNAIVRGHAEIYDHASVYGYAWVYDDAKVWGCASISGHAHVYGDARIYGNAKVHGNAIVCGFAHVCGNVNVYENAKVYGDSILQGRINIREDDDIKDKYSYLIFNNTWSSGRQFVYVLSNQRWHVGCFDGTGEELIKKAYKDSELSGKMYELYVHFAERAVRTQAKIQQRKQPHNECPLGLDSDSFPSWRDLLLL